MEMMEFGDIAVITRKSELWLDIEHWTREGTQEKGQVGAWKGKLPTNELKWLFKRLTNQRVSKHSPPKEKEKQKSQESLQWLSKMLNLRGRSGWLAWNRGTQEIENRLPRSLRQRFTPALHWQQHHLNRKKGPVHEQQLGLLGAVHHAFNIDMKRASLISHLFKAFLGQNLQTWGAWQMLKVLFPNIK